MGSLLRENVKFLHLGCVGVVGGGKKNEMRRKGGRGKLQLAGRRTQGGTHSEEEKKVGKYQRKGNVYARTFSDGEKRERSVGGGLRISPTIKEKDTFLGPAKVEGLGHSQYNKGSLRDIKSCFSSQQRKSGTRSIILEGGTRGRRS